MTDLVKYVFAERKRAIDIANKAGLTVIYERVELRGYQIYIVEQWVCDRSKPSKVVKVFTGDDSHVIYVAVIGIPYTVILDPSTDVQQLLDTSNNWKQKPTEWGEILLADLTELSFDTDPILVPNGDYDSCIKQAYVNINLRRTNCSGRSLLNLLSANSPTSEEKFRAAYKIADVINFNDAVIHLVILVQKALFLFGLLNKECIDGLICNSTTEALWTFYEQYNPVKLPDFTLKEPWMEPHLVAAIITKLLVCRNKLQDMNFTNVKDPFTDYETFSVDIGAYQKFKDMPPTCHIDLETLKKISDHPYNQLNVRKVFKSKFEDISGTASSPLFVEKSDPELFKHHSTIESLRAVWRPKLKGSKLSKSNEKALGKLSRVAKFSWMTDNKKSDQKNTPTSASTSTTTQHMSPEIPPADSLAIQPIDQRKLPSQPQPTMTHSSQKDTLDPIHEHALSSRPTVPPNYMHLDVPPHLQTMLISENDVDYSDDADDVDETDEMEDSDMGILMTSSKSTELYMDSLKKENGGTFDTYDMKTRTKQHKGHNRSSSDTVLMQPTYYKSSFGAYIKNRMNRVIAEEPADRPMSEEEADRLMSEESAERLMSEESTDWHRERSNSESGIDSSKDIRSRASIAMDIQTYIIYESLCKRQAELKNAHNEMKKIADIYEKIADNMKNAYEKRYQEFNKIKKEAEEVVNEQNKTEKRVREVDDRTAKLHYDAKILNDRLREIEDNVGSFYVKVGNLEQKMDYSQKSITTMIIVGNYFNHYWIKIKAFLDRLNIPHP